VKPEQASPEEGICPERFKVPRLNVPCVESVVSEPKGFDRGRIDPRVSLQARPGVEPGRE
jgi:hypothetical protein